MNFHFTGLPLEPFKAMFALSDAELQAQGMRRYIADEKPGFPCRVTLEDAEPGEALILLSYAHQPAEKSPYRAEGPIFVRQAAVESYRNHDEIPPVLQSRLLSLRGYDQDDLIVEAEVVEGTKVEAELAKFFANPEVAYVHIHYARRGCFACRVDRAENRITANGK
ncbi:MAG TPA: DUF1203 domain-containing protein [Dongiaceae bacterium]|nr:DUF1203 domain-containing protein [Dongiaceae bacterium]